MLYADLTPEDKAVVDNTVNLVCSASGQMGRIFNDLQAIKDDTNAVALVTSVDAGDTIPNTSGLAGADDMTRAEIVAVYTTLTAIQGAEDTPANRAAWSKAAGINAMIR